MARVRFSETIEIGNRLTGYYREWTKEAEFEGTAPEIQYLIASTAARLKLPGVSGKGSSVDNIMIDSFHKLLKLEG
ncbi:hypothetical protein HQ531_12795 [bacterium]|nr:hypothetical protein [bacterium]